MPSLFKYAAVALAAAAPFASAQTYTDCNPLEKTCPADAGTTESKLNFDFTQSSGLNKWKTTAGSVSTGPNGAVFTINKRGDAPTIETDFYIFYGEISVTMQASPGTGIVSSIVFESDDLDEIDWVSIDSFLLTCLIYALFDLMSNNGYRRLSVATLPRSRPTTSARVIPPPMIAPLGPALPTLSLLSTPTR